MLAFYDLDVVGNTIQYPGPVCIIRRTQDDIMNVDHGEFSSNVGNEILSQVILSRHKQVAADWTAATLLKEKLKLTSISNTLSDEEAARHLASPDFA